MTSFLRKTLMVLWFPLAVVITWSFASDLFSNPFFTHPRDIFSTLFRLLDGPFLQMYVVPTLQLVFSGYLIGATTGVILGTAVGYHPRVLEICGPIIIFLRSIPSAARVSVLIAIFGIGMQSLILAVAFSATFHVAMMTMGGVARTASVTLDSAHILRLSFLHRLFLIRIPAAAGDILTSLQTSLQVSILVAVLVETIASGRGMGTFTAESLSLLRISHIWVSVLVLGTLGLILNELFHVLERKLAPWYFQTTAH